MNQKEFNEVIIRQTDRCKSMLVAKGAEYAPRAVKNTAVDRLAHFKKAAVVMNTTPKAIELASYLGIGKNQMSRIESGKANCTIPQLYCIAQILDCSADFLLFGEEHMNYSPEMVELVNNLKMVTGRIEGEIKNSLLKTTNQKR